MLDVLIPTSGSLPRSRSSLVGAQHDRRSPSSMSPAAIGRLIVPELKLPVQLYDMDKHYSAEKDKLYGFGSALKE